MKRMWPKARERPRSSRREWMERRDSWMPEKRLRLRIRPKLKRKLKQQRRQSRKKLKRPDLDSNHLSQRLQ